MPRSAWLPWKKKQKSPASKASDRSPLHHCPTGASSSNTQPRIQEDDPIKVILTDEERANRVEKSKDASIGKGLWTEARSRLDPDRLVQLGKHIDEDNKGLQKAAKAKLEAIRSSRLKIKIGQNKELVVRDGVTKVIKTILSYSDLISAAVAAEPHASLAWGGVAALLPLLSTAMPQTETALNDLDKIATLLVRFRAIEVMYDLSEHPEERFVAPPQIKELHVQLRDHTIDLYTQILEYQIDAINHFSHSKLRRTAKNVASPSRRSVSDIETTADSASLTLQILDSGAMGSLGPQLSSLREDFKETLDRMAEINTNVLDISKTKRIRDLPLAACAAFNEGLGGSIPDLCYEDTRKEVLDIIHSWGEGRDGGNNCIFWLSGMAGTGKSTIARTVAREFNDKGHLGASFFFSRGKQDRGESEKFFSSLARGLSATIPGFDICLYQSIPEYDEIHHRSLKEQWNTLIFQPLKSLASSLLVPLHLVLVIDALDECKGTKAVPAIISLLLEARSLERIHLKIFVTSRNEKHIVESLIERSDVTHLSLEEGVGARNTERDISIYVKSVLLEIATENKLIDWPQEAQTDQLLQFCGRLFIAAATACRFLQDSHFPEEKIVSFLNTERTSNYGTGPLDDMYRHLIDAAADCSDKDTFIEYFPIVVGTILVAKEPVSVLDLESLLGLSSKLIHFILDRLRSVLIVPANAPIQLFHLSFREFLIDKSRCQDKRFFIDEDKVHRRSFEYCLKLISGCIKKDICAINHPGTLLSEIDKDRILEHVPWVTRYGCQYWASHLNDASITPSDTEAIDIALKFLHDHLLHWIETLALLGRMDDAVHGTANLKRIPVDSKHRPFTFFVNDANRFVLYHRATIQKAPLQVYYLATFFTPTDSLIRDHFSEHCPKWVRNPLGLESNWGREEQIFPATNTVKVIAISLDGKSVALFAHGANAINVWNVITGELQYTFHIKGKEEEVECLLFSEDGTELIAILIPFSYPRHNDGHMLKAWSLVTGKFMTTLTRKQSDLLSLTEIRNWSFLPGKQELYTIFEPAFDPIYEVALSADGTTMSLCCSSFVYIGNTDTKCITHVLDLSMTVRDVQLSATRAAIRIQHLPEETDPVIVWDLINDKEIDIEVFKNQPVQDVERFGERFGPQTSFAHRFSLSPDGINLAYADETRFEIWNLDSKEVKHSMRHQGQITRLKIFPDGSKLMVAGLTPSAQLWDLEQPDDSIAPRSYDTYFYRVLLSNDGAKVVLSAGFPSNDPKIWDLVEAKPTLEDLGWLRETMICDDVIVARLSPGDSEQEENNEQEKQSEQEGLWLWSLARDMDLEIRGTVIPTSSSHFDNISFAISQDRDSIALIKKDGVLETWGFSQDDRSWRLRWKKGPGIGISKCPCITFSSDGARVLICSDFFDSQHTDGCNITVWCFENANCEFEIHESNEKLNHATLSHDSTMLAMGLSTGVKIYNLPNENANILLVREGVPWLMAFSPQNTRIAVGWSSGDVSIHNIAAGTVEWVFQSQPMLVNVLRFSSDDSWNEEPFYTLDPSGEWILHDNKRVLALPEKFCEKGSNPRLVGRQDYRANTMAFFTRNGRLATFLFDGVPSF